MNILTKLSKRVELKIHNHQQCFHKNKNQQRRSKRMKRSRKSGIDTPRETLTKPNSTRLTNGRPNDDDDDDDDNVASLKSRACIQKTSCSLIQAIACISFFFLQCGTIKKPKIIPIFLLLLSRLVARREKPILYWERRRKKNDLKAKSDENIIFLNFGDVVIVNLYSNTLSNNKNDALELL